MLPGMNASVIIEVERFEDILCLPVEAIEDIGGKSYVYLGYDEKAETLTQAQEVETGVSDGSLVQIVSGLSMGQSFYYAYYDSSSSVVEFPFFP